MTTMTEATQEPAVKTMTRVECIEAAPDHDLLFADGFDSAIIGVGERCGQEPVIVYDIGRCIIALQEGGMSQEDAWEYFTFNTLGAWVGEQTPMWVTNNAM